MCTHYFLFWIYNLYTPDLTGWRNIFAQIWKFYLINSPLQLYIRTTINKKVSQPAIKQFLTTGRCYQPIIFVPDSNFKKFLKKKPIRELNEKKSKVVHGIRNSRSNARGRQFTRYTAGLIRPANETESAGVFLGLVEVPHSGHILLHMVFVFRGGIFFTEVRLHSRRSWSLSRSQKLEVIN